MLPRLAWWYCLCSSHTSPRKEQRRPKLAALFCEIFLDASQNVNQSRRRDVCTTFNVIAKPFPNIETKWLIWSDHKSSHLTPVIWSSADINTLAFLTARGKSFIIIFCQKNCQCQRSNSSFDLELKKKNVWPNYLPVMWLPLISHAMPVKCPGL